MFELAEKRTAADRVGFFSCPGDCFLEKDRPFAYERDLLRFRARTTVELFDGRESRLFVTPEAFTFDPATHLDRGEHFEVGGDYSVCLCLEGERVRICISENGTYPDGFDAHTSRKVGGFHYGTVRKVSDDGLWIPIDSNGVKFGTTGTPWQKNVTLGIVPNSVWDLKNRPRVLFGGLAKVGGIWVSIYQASKAAEFSFMEGENQTHVCDGLLQSRYGAYPVSGIDGLCQFNMAELAARSGMRLLKYSEWLAAAYGAPLGQDEGNDFGWCDVGNKVRARTGCRVNNATGKYDEQRGVKPFAVSARNIVDPVGNVWEWLGEYTNRHDAGEGLWTYYDQLGQGMGQYYGWKTNSFSSLAAGGHWHRGSCCGPRAINPDDQPWNVNVHIGTRLACEPK